MVIDSILNFYCSMVPLRPGFTGIYNLMVLWFRLRLMVSSFGFAQDSVFRCAYGSAMRHLIMVNGFPPSADGSAIHRKTVDS